MHYLSRHAGKPIAAEYIFNQNTSPMRKTALFIALLATTATTLTAQLAIGPRAGAHFARASFDPKDGRSVSDKVGLVAGAVLEIGLGDNLALQPEASYVQRGYQTEQTLLGITTETELAMNYLDFGGLLKLRSGNDEGINFYLAGGAFYSIAMDGELTNRAGPVETVVEIKFDDDYDRSDINLSAGGGFTFGSGAISLFVDGRYLFGLRDIEQRDKDFTINNRGVSVSAGLMFQL